jgi:hypothetical protein
MRSEKWLRCSHFSAPAWTFDSMKHILCRVGFATQLRFEFETEIKRLEAA